MADSILFKYDPHDGREGKVSELAKLCAERYYDSDRKDIPYSTLAFTIGRDRRVYYAPAGLDFDYEARLEAARLSEARSGGRLRPYSGLIVYDLKSQTRLNLGMLATRDGRHVFGCGGAAAGPDGNIYFGAAVEAQDPVTAAGKVAGVHPFNMELLIYKPGPGRTPLSTPPPKRQGK